MSRNIVLLGHMCSGHGPYAPRPNISASSIFLVDGIGVHRAGDNWAVHCVGPSCHGSTMGIGQSKFLCEGKPVAFVGDPVLCGSVCAQGNPKWTID